MKCVNFSGTRSNISYMNIIPLTIDSNYGKAPEIDIWTVDFSYISHVKRTNEIQKRSFFNWTFVTAVLSPNVLVLITEMTITICIFIISSTLTKYCKSQC